MENTDINISALENVDIDRILKEAIKEKIEKLMEIYPRSEFQLCTIHYTRGLKSNVRDSMVPEEITDMKRRLIN